MDDLDEVNDDFSGEVGDVGADGALLLTSIFFYELDADLDQPNLHQKNLDQALIKHT